MGNNLNSELFITYFEWEIMIVELVNIPKNNLMIFSIDNKENSNLSDTSE